MKAAIFIVLSLSALAFAGPAFNKIVNNQIETTQAHQQQHMTTGDVKPTAATEILKEWCFSSQMSQPELTASFKKLLKVVKSSPEDQTTEAAVMSERICQGAIVQKSAQSGDTLAQKGADAQAHELIKDVYMDALIACESRQCMQQLVKIINSNKVDTIRASYYMTRIAVTEKDSIKDDTEQAKQLAESFLSTPTQASGSEAIERQKLFAVTALLNKSLKNKQQQAQSSELKQTAEKVAKTIVDRYIKSVSQQEVQQYNQQQPQQQSSQVAKKIAKRNAALKALANIPAWAWKGVSGVEETLVQLAQDKQEMLTARQSAIECLEECESAYQQLKQTCFDSEEPIEVRVAALRALMTVVYAGDKKDEQSKQQIATEIVDQIVKHCEDQTNQQQDDQFVLYAISYLDNLRTSLQPEHQAIKECIAKNKQHYMQIQLLCKKFHQQLSDIRKSSRNFKLAQEFNQLESGLIIEGDLVYESKQQQQKQHQQHSVLPKLVRFNMSMPVMGETVNVVEVTVRQNQMDQELLGALKLVQGAKFNSESMSKVVDSFKSSVEQQSQQSSKSAEADLTIKMDGCNVVYICVDDFKSGSSSQKKRSTRSVYSSESLIEDIIEHLKRKPVAFNRGLNFNLNERLAKVLDVDANIIAGLRFESRASGQSAKDFEINAQVEPRFAFEAIVGPAKMSSKKLLQRVSTKTALGLRLRFKSNELVDVQVDLPMNIMELFTVETQLVEKNKSSSLDSYSYLPNSIYGQDDIYSPDEDYYYDRYDNYDDESDNTYKAKKSVIKRSIFEKKSGKSVFKFMQSKSKRTFAHSVETPEDVARATGLRAKLRVVAAPSDMSFLVQAVAQKYDPKMQGYRVQVQKVQRGSEQKQYIVTLSTPGSRVDRTMQLRVIKQANSQRTIFKSDIQSPKMAATAQVELVHDGRQYSVKVEMASSRGKQWHHTFESGVQRNSQSQSARVATTYKPYISIDSTSLRRPLQMQGVVSYQQQSPKSVISYELRNPISGDYVQGKIIFDQQRSSYNKRGSSYTSTRRSMQSPIEIFAQNDLTLTNEIVAQVAEQIVKVHNMIDWDASKQQVAAEFTASHKNLRKSSAGESQLVASLKLDEQQQLFTVQRKCPQQERKEYQLNVQSQFTNKQSQQPTGHQMVAELRYNGKRSTNAIVAYKHKIDYAELSSKHIDLAFNVELIASERQINEKFSGRHQITFDRKMKTLKSEMSSRGKSAKIDAEYVSLNQHQIEVQIQDERLTHRTSVRADQRQFSVQSRTEYNNRMLNKVALELFKQQGECQVVVEMPTQNSRYSADLKFQPGKLSSVAVQTPRFASKAEFSFETMARGKRNQLWRSLTPFSQLKFKTDLKDIANQEAYWIDSLYNSADNDNSKSYLRLSSPAYRSELEFDPREQSTKFGAFARSKRSISNYNKLYSNDESLLSSVSNKLNLGSDKLWMLRSILSSPSSSSASKDLKQAARRALFEYADRRQAHRHSFNVDPTDERISFDFDRQANLDYPTSGRIAPMRLRGDLNTRWSQYPSSSSSSIRRPSTLSMESDYVDFDFDAKPFDGEESYAKLTALSRHPRSPFNKHESSYSYKKHGGYKAYMKHQDADQKKHSLQFEADESPKKWAKMAYESDKHGKGTYEHNWRKNASKRSSGSSDDDDYYQNKVSFYGQSSPLSHLNNWSHRTSVAWEEPKRMTIGGGRIRRDTGRDYSTFDYLKHLNARLDSQTYKNQAELYNVDFDYKPDSYLASLNVIVPDDMMHSSNIAFDPTERIYKLQSKLFNRRTQEPSYELLASTKPIISGLATADQEPVFINEQYPISNTFASTLFRQPLKLDYTDKYGRIARFDYDQSPIVGTVAQKYAGLRQKRAALYYKDDSMDFEHNSSYDFHPEAVFGDYKQKSGASASRGVDFTVKTNTKYGPVALRADSDDETVELQLQSPIIKAKLTTETSNSKYGSQIIKFTVDNKQQSVQLNKVIRSCKQVPRFVKDCPIVQKWANKFDQGKFEHQTELLVSIVDAIFKIKSQTTMNQRPVLQIDGELNRQQEKVYVKIDGVRSQGQLVVDLINKSANLVMDVDDKRTIQHQTRVTRLNDKFYSLESMTSYKQQPLFKLSGKVSSMIFLEPQHLFARRRSGSSAEEHISQFEAVVYEPKHMQITGQYDCLNKEARVLFKNVDDKRIQETRIVYDDETDTILVDATLTSPRGQIYNTHSKINLPGLMEPSRCHHGQSCQSEVNYAEKSGVWSAKYAPGGYISINTPYGKRW